MSEETARISAPNAQTLDDPRCTYRGIHEPHLHEAKWYGVSKTIPSLIEEYQCPGTPVALVITRRRICSRYDSVCLEGGCGFCANGRWRTLERIEREVNKSKNMKNIGAFLWGKKREFCNAPIEFNDGSRSRPYRARH